MKKSGMIGVAVVLAGLCLPALGQEHNDQPLKGPEVKDHSEPGKREKFGEPARGERRRGPDGMGGMPGMELMGGLSALRGEKAAPEVRLSEEQDTQIRALMETYRGEVQAYMDQHEGEIRKLREQAGVPGRRERGPEGRPAPEAQPKNNTDEMAPPPPPAPEGEGKAKPDPEQRRALMEKMREIRDGAPKPPVEKVMGVLRPEQQKVVRERMEKAKDRRGERREEMREQIKERRQKREGGGGENAPRNDPGKR